MSPEDRRLIGASDLGAIFQVSDWSGWVSLWARICRGYEWGGSRATRAGNLAEDYHRALYTLDTGYALEGSPRDADGNVVSLRHPLLPWARCSPDATALETPEGRRGVELKQSERGDAYGPAGTEQIPQGYWLQVQMQGGFCSDVAYWDSADVDVSVLLYGRRRSYPVRHQPEAWERIQAACERFWRDFVVPNRCPEGEGMRLLERDCEALLACFPAPAPDALVLQWEALSDSERAMVSQWLAANAARKQWEKQEDALGRQVRHLLREHPGLDCPGHLVEFNETKSGRPLVAREKRP